ncbi:MAG: flagellar protein FlbB [Spirochaetales bacterium]|uniref:Flagellar protein FlbB n=1 Tax=Candidatus Thalassospirochaeta sargassi TaxID=3119039 RepID=A0AAJ1MP15_9SPIO|nr:flagellar protein FlbB [Spirochaetales bacterium]
MPRITAVRSGARVFALILLILILILGGFVWFDYLGIINVKEMFSPVVTPVATRLGLNFGLPEPIENVEDLNLLEKERLNKRGQALEMLESELNIRQAEIESREAEIQQMLDSLAEREAAFEEQEKSFNDRLKEYDNRSTNLRQAAVYFVGMPPEDAVAMFIEMDDQDVIDIMRAHQKISDEEGSASMVSYWLSLMPPERSATLNRKMLKKPES